MGMFDSVYANCPKCGKSLEFQSKEGPCELKKYHQNSVPPVVALDLSGKYGDTTICCDTEWKLVGQLPKRVTMVCASVEEDEEWD